MGRERIYEAVKHLSVEELDKRIKKEELKEMLKKKDSRTTKEVQELIE